MDRIDFVRHGPSAVSRGTPPATWPLTPAGRTAVRELAARMDWTDVSLIASSNEVKAVETARMLAEHPGLKCHQWEDLRELWADWFDGPDELQQRFEGYLETRADSAFEPWAKASARIVRAVSEIQAAARPGRAVVVSHGRILTVYFSTVLGRVIPVSRWAQMQFPDLVVYDSAANRILDGVFKDVDPG